MYPKRSKCGEKFEDHGINWWHTPPESPNLNSIENLWNNLKEFIRQEVKPKTKDELVSEILRFWPGHSRFCEISKVPPPPGQSDPKDH